MTGSDHVRNLAVDRCQLVLALGQQLVLEAVLMVEVVLDGALAAAVDEDHLLDPGGNGLLHRVLDQRFVHHRQHFLGHGLGRRQETGAHARHREDGLAQFCAQTVPFWVALSTLVIKGSCLDLPVITNFFAICLDTQPGVFPGPQ